MIGLKWLGYWISRLVTVIGNNPLKSRARSRAEQALDRLLVRVAIELHKGPAQIGGKPMHSY